MLLSTSSIIIVINFVLFCFFFLSYIVHIKLINYAVCVLIIILLTGDLCIIKIIINGIVYEVYWTKLEVRKTFFE